ncbi:MAG: hypothetical protein J6X94_11555 [Lachnospiraceae bacterium]|nr:hypothetical protein [Lachnospiraceae bacterium]
MSVYLSRFLMFLKARLKSPFTYIWMILIAFSLYLVSESVIPLSEPSEVLILNEAGEYGERIFELLEVSSEHGGAYVYTEADDEESLRAMVRKGRAACGFIFPEDMEEKIASGDTRHMIVMITSTFSAKGPAVRESVFAALYRVMNEDVIDAALESLFEDPGLVRDYVRDRYEYYVGSDEVFGLEYEVAETAPDASTDFLRDSSDPIRGTAAVLIFILGLYSASSYFGKAGRFFKALGRKEKAISLFLYEISSIIIPAVCGLVMIRILHPGDVPLFRDLLVYVVFVLFSCIWSGVFVSFFKRSEKYLPAVSVLMFVCFAICPVFFDIAGYFPVIRYITSLLPPAFYLYML